MSFEEKTLTCSDCSATFAFSVEDQEFYQSKGFTNEPKRCPACRQTRKTERYGGGSGYGAPRQMFPVTCAECGQSTEVPFQPRGDKPVYCSDCFRKIQPSR
ncbi:MAG: CxxC-x17-CxxC domain-containing protein [Dehalococcoidales bacterium]